MPRDIRRDLDRLARRPDNIRPREIEKVAKDADWTHRRTTGGHAIYTKPGQPRPLSIPQHPGALKRGTAKKLIERIRQSL
ncbi:MAG: type II toxin-antitoxin system HicA family toxin [Chloroflexi bacterium]|nr:type II toxin-antitoxin system HicA family toxin [Chloroflexota bacterium]